MNQVAPALDLTVPSAFGVQVERDRFLAALTTMKVGGKADYFATVTTLHQLLRLVRWARASNLPYFLLGGGSNILISDAGIRGLVIYNRCRDVRLDRAPCSEFAQDDRPYLVAESGAAMAGVARRSVNEGLTGLEWAVSLPGTVGGAVVGNAGAYGAEVKDNLASVLLMDDTGAVNEVGIADLNYAYRDSALKRRQTLRAGFGSVVLSAEFRLSYGDASQIKARADGYLAHRRTTQPVEPSLGSTFVNPPHDHAGRLIEAAGLKGARVGGVQVSRTHANFIVNPGGVGRATASDVLELMDLIQDVVLERFGVRLQREVQLAGEW